MASGRPLKNCRSGRSAANWSGNVIRLSRWVSHGLLGSHVDAAHPAAVRPKVRIEPISRLEQIRKQCHPELPGSCIAGDVQTHEPGVSEETRSGVHEVARLHTNNADRCYHPRLCASRWCLPVIPRWQSAVRVASVWKLGSQGDNAKSPVRNRNY